MKEQMPEVPSGIVPLSVADMEFVLAEEIRQGIGDALQNHHHRIQYADPRVLRCGYPLMKRTA